MTICFAGKGDDTLLIGSLDQAGTGEYRAHTEVDLLFGKAWLLGSGDFLKVSDLVCFQFHVYVVC